MSIRDALTLRDYSATLSSGVTVTLRRPSALDLIEGVQFSTEHPNRLHAWFVQRHLIEDGAQVFASLDEVLGCDAHRVTEIAQIVERLYAEGRD